MKLKTVKTESKLIDFKESFDGSQGAREWCNIIKDIIAMANSGGGTILIGVNDDGTSSGFDVTDVLALDPADITNKIHTYTHEHFSDFEIMEIIRDGCKVAVLKIEEAYSPIAFCVEGAYSYTPSNGKQVTKTVFSKGTFYFRHGAKSEPGTTNDIRVAIDRRVSKLRKNWFSNIRKVVQAPPNYQVIMVADEAKVKSQKGKQNLSSETMYSPSDAFPMRLTDDPNAPAFRLTDDPNAPTFNHGNPDISHPFFMRELVNECNKQLAGVKKISQFDIIHVRKTYDIDNKDEFYYKSRRFSPQYSQAFLNWLIDQFNKNPMFFDDARQKRSSK